MTEFLVPADIGNRALQHCGAERMGSAGFAENSKRAAEVSFAYGKLRRAELERNVWVFATRRAMLRPIDSNTMLIAPTLFNLGTTYFVGSLATDGSGNIWQSRVQPNLGNDPQNTAQWEPYFGPMSCDPYDSTAAYSAGEIVYTAPGNGTYNVYSSLVNNNVLDPSLPNQWSVATTYFKADVVQVFPAWASGTTYTQGQTVQYTDGNWYSSLVNGNVGNVPATNVGTKWALVPILVLQSLQVPATSLPSQSAINTTPVGEWAQGTTYSLGSFVMFNGTEYVSIQNANAGNFPNAAGSTWWAQVTSGTFYQSMIDLNLGNSPASSPAAWAAGTSYAAGNTVCGSDGVIYSSVGSGNIGNNPVTDGGVHWTNTGALCPWTVSFVQGGGNGQWLQIGGSSSPSGVALTQLIIVYPIGVGPLSQVETKNAFRLPNGFLKKCSQDPKAGSTSWLGAPSGLYYDDWLFEGPYIVSREAQPIMLRFIADVTDVTTMATQFCEGLACRIALEVCEPLTQSTAKLGNIAKEYEKFMDSARLSNAILVGAEEPPLDDWITCRY